MAVNGHQSSVGVHPGCHEEGTGDEGNAASPAIDEDEGENGHEYVDDVLDGRSDKVVVTL